MYKFKNTRYNRQEQMPEWGPKGQKILKNSSVVVIGAGGVKSTLLLILVASGVGRIRIIDFDKVELSNLNRQILYRTSDIGFFKAEAAYKTLHDLNPDINIEIIKEKISKENIFRLCNDFDFIVEGGESPGGRNLVNEFCLKNNKPFTHASAQFSYGYVFSVIPKDKTACFACFFPEDHTRQKTTGPVPVNALSTSTAGALGASEVLKYLLGYKKNMFINRRICFSSLLLSSEFSIEKIQRIDRCLVCSKYYNKIKN